MGRAKQQVFEYTFEGKYLGRWETIDSFRKHHYSEDIGKRPLFQEDIDEYKYQVTESESIAFLERPYRDKIKFILKMHNSVFCNLGKNASSNKAIQMYNLKNELLAEFSSLKIAEIILKEDYPSETIRCQLRRRKNEGAFGIGGDYYFKYKTA